MLQEVTSRKEYVMTAIENATEAFSDNNAAVQQQMAALFPNAAEREATRQQIVSNLKTAHEQASTAVTDPRWFMPRGPMAGLVQAAMDVREDRPDAGAARPAIAEAPLEKFGPLDPGWIECLLDGL